MPLTRKVTFQGVLAKNNNVQVPKLIRRQFKMEPHQVLKSGHKRFRPWTRMSVFSMQK
jgi:hypothetical protein